MVDNNNITYFEALHEAKKQALHIRPDVIERLFLERLNWGKMDLVLNGQNNMLQQQYEQFCSDVNRLVLDEPLQYIIGKEWFFDREFIVNSHVLIPRQETQQLVQLVLDNCQTLKSPKILDIGTGSGAIGITLKKEMPQSIVTLSDISSQALHIAKQNATRHEADVTLVESDVFDNIEGIYDVIVSNPPYIAYDEVGVMDKSVIAYEPHVALFAKHNGLFIYEKILQGAKHFLSDKGMLFFEIGYLQGDAVVQLCKKHFPNKQVCVHKDYAQHDRMISVK